jgi:hypothetical protein
MERRGGVKTSEAKKFAGLQISFIGLQYRKEW